MELDKYMTLKEAAEELGVSKVRVDQYVRDGRLEIAGTVGGVRLLLKTAVAELKATPKRPHGRPRKAVE